MEDTTVDAYRVPVGSRVKVGHVHLLVTDVRMKAASVPTRSGGYEQRDNFLVDIICESGTMLTVHKYTKVKIR